MSPLQRAALALAQEAIAKETGLLGKLKAAGGVVARLAGFLRTSSSGGGSKPPEPKAAPAGGAGKRPRKTEDVDTGDAKPKRIRKIDPALTGEMIPVQSSNVHSIGFRIDDPEDMQTRTGTLLIRYLGTGQDGKRTGAGPMYEYYSVPVMVFQRFRKAASKGRFVWDEVRQRGTISGHQYAYALADIQGNYVPRQAGLKRGQQGEYYLRRKFRTASGRLLTSELPERQVRTRGPNRAAPNTGKPNTGRPC